MARWSGRRGLTVASAVLVALAVVVVMVGRGVGGGGSDEQASPVEGDSQSSDPPAPPPLSPSDAASGTAGETTTSSGGPSGSSSPDARPSSSPAATLPAVPLEREADFGDGIVGQVVAARAVRAEAAGPGEIAGPAIAYTIRLANRGERAEPLDAVTVNAYYGADDTPASPMTNDRRADPLAGQLEPRSRTEGTYVFRVPQGQRDALRIEVSHAALSPIAVFEGPLP